MAGMAASRGRRALADRIEEAGARYGAKAGHPGATGILYDLARVIRRDEERSDREARRLIALLGADRDFAETAGGIPLLGPGELAEWFELMLRAEALDRLRAGGREAGRDGDEPRWVVMDEMADWPDPGPVVRDGQTRGRTT